MYNSDLKLRFIKEKNKSVSRAKVFSSVFQGFEQFEQKAGVDLCAMSVEQLQDAFDSMRIVKSSVSSEYICMMREYAKWCADTGVDGATGNIFQISGAGVSAVKETMIANPLHLQMILDGIFGSEDEETMDNVYRAFFWLAYCGVHIGDIAKIRRQDVKDGGTSVYVDGKRYRIYSDGAKSIMNCASLSSFMRMNSNYKKARGTRFPRVDGDLLLRGIVGELKVSSIVTITARSIRLANTDGRIKSRISYQTVWTSGLYFYAYQREKAGIDPDFEFMAKLSMSDRDFIDEEHIKRGVRNGIRRHREDYNRWKIAFNL